MSPLGCIWIHRHTKHEKEIKTNSFCSSTENETVKHKVVALEEKSLSRTRTGKNDIKNASRDKVRFKDTSCFRAWRFHSLTLPSKNRLGYMLREIKPGRPNGYEKNQYLIVSGNRN